MPRLSALSTLLDKEQLSNAEFNLWSAVIMQAWFDSTTRNDTRAIHFFLSSDSVFEEICTFWALPIEAIRDRLKKVLADRQIQQHLDGRKLRRTDARKEPALPPVLTTQPITGWRSTL
jgi:hypothetical protein